MGERITLPGLIDPHVHFREPGSNTAETIASGTEAALIGGYALVADMPNNPGHPTWTAERVEEKLSIARRSAYIRYAVNAGAQPESDNIGEIEGMMQLAIALKLYGGRTTGVDRQQDYEAYEFRPIVKELRRVAPDKPILFHAGKNNVADMIGLVADTHVHHLHICHVNDPEQVDMVTKARRQDLPITCGVCPHHLLKTAHARQTEGKFAEMQPPLAPEVDAEQLIRQLANGDIQIIETDHAPHTKGAKMEAEISGGDCFGVPGIELAVPLMLYQVKIGNLTIERLIDAMSTQPARLLGVELRDDTDTEWELTPGRIEYEDDIVSSAGWTPYLGMLTGGRLLKSHISGKIVYYDQVYRRSHEPVTSRGESI